jgi:selenocysteine-specific elongation factor
VTQLRRNIMLGTAGHVDHGKSALVKLLTGCETDTLAEEKQRGLTIDIGFAPCHLADDRIVGIVDVPGHIDFIRNMVAGAHGVDVVILVVAADDGIMPQTREHLNILTLMGLRHGLVALTKIDLVDPVRRTAVSEDLRRLLASTFLANAPICPVSNVTGEGFDNFFDTLNQMTAGCGDHPSSGLFRMWVEDVFVLRGPGTVITGIPSSGVVRVGDTLTLSPGGVTARVRSMQVYGQNATEARAGECVALNIPEIDHATVHRGMTLSAADALSSVTMAEAELRILDSIRGVINDFLEVQFHLGTAAATANVAMLERTTMTAGQSQMVQIRLAEPLPIVPGERFVLRANMGNQGLTTIGGGRIVGIGNTRLRRNKPWTITALQARRDSLDNPALWCETLLREAAKPLSPRELQQKCFLHPDEMPPLLERLRKENRLIALPDTSLVHPALIQDTGTKMLAALTAFHTANPQRAGMAKEELFAAAGLPAPACEAALSSLLSAKKLQPSGAVFALPGRNAQLAGGDEPLCDQIAAAFLKAGWAAPDLATLSAAVHQPPARIEKLVRLLTERAVLIRVDAQLCIHKEALAAAKQVALKLFQKKTSFTTMDFRDALAVSRKYAVPLADYLDKTRFTVRSGNNRTPGAEAKKLLLPRA